MFIFSLCRRLCTARNGVGFALSLLVALLVTLPVAAGIYEADTPTTYKEYWVSHNVFTGGNVEASLPTCVDTRPQGRTWYVEPWGQCRKNLAFTIPDDFSQALKVEVYLDLWRNRNSQSARFQINGGATYQPPVGSNWSRTPYVMEIAKSDLRTGANTITIWNTAGPYHIHDIAVRVYYDAAHPLRDGSGQIISAPQGELVSVWAKNGLFAAADGGTLQVDNDLVVLTANVTTPAKLIEFHAYYDGYDEDNDGVSRDWHNLGRNNYHPGGIEEQPIGGTINHIGTMLTPAPGQYTMAWRLPHIVNQSGVRFKIRLVAADGNVQDAAGGSSASFELARTGATATFISPTFNDTVLHHDGEFPDTASRSVSINVDPVTYNQAFLIGAFWETPDIAVNGNPSFSAFVGSEDNWALSIRALPTGWFKRNTNKIDYFYTRGFGQFIEKPGPMIVLKQNTAETDNTPPVLTPLSPTAGATAVEPNGAITLQVADSGLGVNLNAVTLKVNGLTVQPTVSGSPALYTLTYTPTTAFAYESQVTVAIDACDYANRCITGQSYSFTVRPNTYTLATNVVGMGTLQITPTAATYPVDTAVTVLAAAELGWSFQDWSGTATGTETALALVMNQNHIITATFTQDQYQLMVEQIGNGSISVTPDQPTYLYGDVITLTAAADPGASFTGWTGPLISASPIVTITMTENQVITGTFTPLEYTLNVNRAGEGEGTVASTPTQATYLYGDVVAVAAVAAPGSSFSGWSGALTAVEPQLSVTITDNVALTANFARDYYALSLTIVDDSGNPTTQGAVTVSPPADNRGYIYGETATLIATAKPGWRFQGWAGSVSGTVPTTALTFDGNEVVTATFAPIYYTITAVAVDDNGTPTTHGVVTISPPKSPLGYVYGELVTVTATPTSGWRFINWRGLLSRSTAMASFTVETSGIATANFTDKTYSLSTALTAVAAGEIVVSPAPPFSFGQAVTLTVVPTAGWEFIGWSGDLSGTANPANLVLNGHKVVTATVARIEYTLQVDVLGGQGGEVGGRVEITPTTGPYYYGDVVTLTAIPNAGYRFVQWTRTEPTARVAPAGDFDPTKPTIEVPVTSSATYLAEFAAIVAPRQNIFLPIIVTQ